MPEGDTIHRAAARLAPALVGRPLVQFEAPRLPHPHPRLGTRIDAVSARGKHLLVAFADGRTLHTHLGMSGSWHLYAPGGRWSRPGHLARVVLTVDDWQAVCFSAPLVRLTTGASLDHLGPDLCDPDADLDRCVRRMHTVAEPGTEVADVLLDQRICCGVGNVYKSEVCFALRLHPRAPIEAVDLATRRALVHTAARLLQANLGSGPRTTAPGRPGAKAVYGRPRRPCLRCGTPIVMARTGPFARSTFWCPRCQHWPAAAAPAPGALR